MQEPLNSFPHFNGAFGDKRIDKRATEALHKLTHGRTSSIRYITESEAEQKSFTACLITKVLVNRPLSKASLNDVESYVPVVIYCAYKTRLSLTCPNSAVA